MFLPFAKLSDRFNHLFLYMIFFLAKEILRWGRTASF